VTANGKQAVPQKIEAMLDSVFFRPAHWHSAHEVAVQRLAQAIKLGALEVGSRLPPERELVQLLGVSRTTLREALRALQQAGYLETSRGRNGGTFVASRQISQLSDADVERLVRQMGSTLRDLIDLRGAVEPKAAELAALRATDDDLENMRWLQDRALKSPVEELRQADSTLHIAIAYAARSDLLLDSVLEVQIRLHDLLAHLQLTTDLKPPGHRSSVQHREVVQAIADRDPAAAREAMAEHIRHTHEAMLALVEAAAPEVAATPP
jgi:DNA-binding FadR family transcriptional regulator